MMKHNKLLSLQKVVHEFDKQDEVAVYLQSAGIFKYLFEKYGIERMKRLWKEGFSRFEEIYDLSLDDFENDWKVFISSVPIPEDFDWDLLMKNGCG